MPSVGEGSWTVRMTRGLLSDKDLVTPKLQFNFGEIIENERQK